MAFIVGLNSESVHVIRRGRGRRRRTARAASKQSDRFGNISMMNDFANKMLFEARIEINNIESSEGQGLCNSRRRTSR